MRRQVASGYSNRMEAEKVLALASFCQISKHVHIWLEEFVSLVIYLGVKAWGKLPWIRSFRMWWLLDRFEQSPALYPHRNAKVASLRSAEGSHLCLKSMMLSSHHSDPFRERSYSMFRRMEQRTSLAWSVAATIFDRALLESDPKYCVLLGCDGFALIFPDGAVPVTALCVQQMPIELTANLRTQESVHKLYCLQSSEHYRLVFWMLTNHYLNGGGWVVLTIMILLISSCVKTFNWGLKPTFC